MQMTYDNDTNKQSYTYIEAIECSEMYPEVEKIITQNYKCPKNESFVLQGNLGQVTQDYVKEFYYTVNSCASMKNIYMHNFNKTWPGNCKDYNSTVLNSLKTIQSRVKVAYTFFDPNYYNKNHKLIEDTYYSETSLYPEFGQIKKYTVAETISTFEDNIWLSGPFKESRPDYYDFTTYSIDQSDFAI